MNINQLLSMNSNQLADIASLALANLASLPTQASLIYEYGGELYFNDVSGTAVQITKNGAINGASIGGITGLGGTTGSVTYSSLAKNFLFESAPGETASIAGGPVSIYTNLAGSFYAKIQQNPAQAGNLDWSLPPTYPASTLPMKSNAAGLLELSQILTAEIADNQITAPKLTTDSVETAKIVNQAVTAAKIANNTITTNQIALSAGITSGQIASNTLVDANVFASANIKRSKLQTGLIYYSTLTTSTTSTSLTTVLSGTLTPQSNLVACSVTTANTSNPSYLSIAGAVASAFGELKITIGSTVIYRRIGGYLNSAGPIYHSPNVLDGLFYVSAGTSNNIVVEIKTSSSAVTLTLSNLQFNVYEY